MKKAPEYKKVDTIQEIMEEELKAVGNPTLRQFAEYLTESLSKDDENTLSHSSIINWRDKGKFPKTDFLEDLLSVYSFDDRRFKFALRCLAVKSPTVWGPDGVVWHLPKAE